MSQLNPQAEELNNHLKENNSAVFAMLSQKGQQIFFPKKGILSQSAEAKDKQYNATIGIATEEDYSPMRLKSIDGLINLPPEDSFPYAPSYGVPALRDTWKEMIYKKNPSLKAETTSPVVTNGLTHGLSIIGHLFLDPEDKVILTDKFWGNYKLIFTHNYGAELETFDTFKDNKFNIEGLREKLLDTPVGKKVLLLNFPNNPTGYTPTNEEAQEITALLKQAAEAGNNLVVVLDDAYFGLVYKEGTFTESLFSYIANLHSNILAVKVDGITKEDYAWGFRVSFITYSYPGMSPEAAKALEDKTAGAVRANISNASKLSQSLALQGFKSPTYSQEKQEKYQILKSRFEEVQKVLSEEKYSEYFYPLPHNSGYFMCIGLKHNIDSEELRNHLLDKYSTGTIAINGLIRVAYSSLKNSDIAPIFENIYKACQDLATSH